MAIAKHLSAAVMVCGFAGSYFLVSNILDRGPPVHYLEATAKETEAQQGGPVEIHFRVYRYKNCEALDIQRTLTDADGEDHAIANYTFSKGKGLGFEDYDRTITIPKEAVTGPATYQVRIKYACNFINHIGWPIVVWSPKVNITITPAPVVLEIPLPDLTGKD